MLILFFGALTAIILIVGLVIDGGNAFAQRRGVQNSSDFGAWPEPGSWPDGWR